MNRRAFFELFCDAYECLPKNFDETVLLLCVFPSASLLVRLLYRLNREFFSKDIELIRQVKHLTNTEDIRQEICDYYYRYPARGLVRRILRARVSGQRLLGLADHLFKKAGNGRPTAGAT